MPEFPESLDSHHTTRRDFVVIREAVLETIEALWSLISEVGSLCIGYLAVS